MEIKSSDDFFSPANHTKAIFIQFTGIYFKGNFYMYFTERLIIRRWPELCQRDRYSKNYRRRLLSKSKHQQICIKGNIKLQGLNVLTYPLLYLFIYFSEVLDL